ncbi:MAG: hypothetical protein IPM92_05910 [Saprospiraceae bacterium]|nr:hypothetical protein [Saprospiraceae bacterium]
MKLLKPVCILGMPASGKSYFAEALALHWEVPCIHLDQVIERAEGRSIEQIWDRYQESAFRSLERYYLMHQLIQKPVVMSLGGGTAAHFDNMFLIQNLSFSIWLKVGLSVLEQRILEKPRPLFQNLDEIMPKLEALMNFRYQYYERASLVVELNNDEPKTLTNVTTYCQRQNIISE